MTFEKIRKYTALHSDYTTLTWKRIIGKIFISRRILLKPWFRVKIKLF